MGTDSGTAEAPRPARSLSKQHGVRIRAGGLGLLIVTLACLAAVAPAAAAGSTLTLSANPGPSDATGVALTANGSTPRNNSGFDLLIHYQPAGGTCAADPDANAPLDPDSTLVPADGGPYTAQSSAPNRLLPGSYLVCGWLQDLDTSLTVATTQLALTVASADTMNIAFSATPLQGRSFDVNATGTSHDADSVVDATYKAAGGTCAPTRDADDGTPVAPGENAGETRTGGYTVGMGSQLLLAPGSYLFCGWLYDQATSQVLAASETVVNVAPLHATMQLHVPAATAGNYPITLDVTLDSSVPVTAWVDTMPNQPNGCPTTPAGAPASAENPIDDDLEETQAPGGTIVTSAQNAPLLSGGPQLVCAWLLDDWSVNVNPQPVVAGPIWATVTVAHNLVFKGRTSQKQPIKLFARPFASDILAVQFRARFRCDGRPRFVNGKRWNGFTNETLSYVVFGAAKPDTSGRFTIREHFSRSHVVVLHGRVQGKTVAGTLSDRARSSTFTDNPRQSLRCQTGTVAFTARTP
jgi:hypothetical protein